MSLTFYGQILIPAIMILLSCHASYASSHGPPSRSPSLWPRRTGWRGSGLRSHGQLKLVRRGREGQQLGGRSVPVLVAAHAVEESIASYVGHMLHVRREPNLHLHLVVIVPVRHSMLGQALEALDQLLKPCRDAGLWKGKGGR
ncbi:hypothetical protein MUK42_32528 [Musa troglodytarum]|uniref:Uncharacterized protein n=1 Tax=Musa troglodytarum TaxID=320322 RepID=A0A9E7IEQ2_9LILI|nr:hypothetical protein MUK42_32528 [Musa troglodytarum]